MKKQIVGHFFLISIITVLLLVMLLIAPYKYTWEESLKQVSDDNILVLNLVSVFVCALSTIGFIYSRKQQHKKMCIAYLIFIILGIIKLLSNLWLTF